MAQAKLRRWASGRAAGRMVAVAERIGAGSRYLKVLRYRRVERPEPFARQVEHLMLHDRIVSVDQVLAALGDEAPLPPRSVLLTFEDRGRDFARVAWPVLRDHGAPATLLVAAGGSWQESWDELRALAAQGLTLGARSDLPAGEQAQAELLAWFDDLEREIPGALRIFAHSAGSCGEQLVEHLRSAGAELAFTSSRGTNDLHRCDPLCLRRLDVDPDDPPPLLRAKLAMAIPPGPLACLLAPFSRAGRRAQRRSIERLRAKFALRALDAAQSAVLDQGAPGRVPRTVASESSRYERMRRGTRSMIERVPSLEPKLRRALVETGRLPFRNARIEPAGHGSWATVFRLDPGAGERPWALKVHRATLGRDVHYLRAGTRRGARRYRRLRAAFGDAVLPGQFLVLHSPLCGFACVACLQPCLTGRMHDLLGLDDGELRELLDRNPTLAGSFAAFARAALATWREGGWIPDLLGEGNLIAAGDGGELRLWLIDYGIVSRREITGSRRERATEGVAERLEALSRDLVLHDVRA